MFERVFRWNSPAEEKFFALTLFFVGSWVAAALAAVLWTYIPALRDVPAAAGSILVCVTMPAAAFLYAVALYCFYSTGGGRMLHRIVFVLAVPLLAALAGVVALSGEAALAVFLACVIWAGPFLFSRRVWHWKLAAAVAWTLAALTLWQGRLFHGNSAPADFRLSNIVTAGGLATVCRCAGSSEGAPRCCSASGRRRTSAFWRFRFTRCAGRASCSPDWSGSTDTPPR